MRTLVTGASGFVGSRVVQALLAAGHDVQLASRNPADHSRSKFVQLPTPDAPDEAFERLVKDVDHVIHCAALNNDARDATDEEFRQANAVLTRKLAQAARRHIKGRFIFTSSSHAVTAGAGGGPDRRSTAYGRSKGEGELAVLECFSDLPERAAAVLRLPPVYGVGMKNRLAQLLKIAKRPIPLPMTGLEKKHAIVSRDKVAEAVLHLVFKSRSLQPVYFASDTSAVSILDIIGAFRDGLERPRLIFRLPGSQALGRFMRNQKGETAATSTHDPSKLVSDGWQPEEHTIERLRDLARFQQD